MKNKSLSYIFLGATHFGREILENLIERGYIPKAIFSIPETFCISYTKDKVKNTNFFDFSKIAEEYKIPLYWVQSPNQPLISYKEQIKDMQASFMLVAGWYYKIPHQIYSLSKMGAFGFHNSLLPKYAGGAPLVWAMIKGERESGVTLFRMNEKMDGGEIILQESFEIAFSDSIAEVLHKATQCAVAMSIKLFSTDFDITFTPQKGMQTYYPQRSPDDGEIDLSWDSLTLYNFIRAQSSPYPGAFIKTSDGKRLVI
ncbi:methionyl-tRNA formyltransferase, partial [Helicobacter mesocricetorum]|uniref:methionyl-tRNA formyltransferase n=1 Tax=Helicobacter mesocricetorum TaxID=87012 RepID=UPI000CF07A42